MMKTVFITLMIMLVLFVILGTIVIYAYLHTKFCDYHGYTAIDERALKDFSSIDKIKDEIF